MAFVAGFVFSGPKTVEISTTGTVDFADSVPATVIPDPGPDGHGINLRATDFGPVHNFTPLDEAFVDANATVSLPANFSGTGA